MAQRYLTALKSGQAVLAKESGDSYMVHTLDMSATGITVATAGSLTMSNIDGDFSASGVELKAPLAVPGTPAAGHIWEASGALKHGASSRTLMNLEGAQTVSGVKTLDATGGLNATAAPDGTGLIIPASAGVPTGANTEGCLVWDSTNDVLYGGKGGTSWQQLTSAAVLPTNTTAGSVIIGTGTGWAEETDVKISSAGLITVEASGGLDFNGVNVDIDNSGTFDVLSAGIFSIDGTGASNVSATSGSLTLSTITSGSLIGTSAADIDLNAATNFTLDCAAGTMSLDCTGVANFTSSGAAVTVSGVGAFIAGGNAEIDVTTTGTVDINSAAGTWDASSGLALTTSAGLFDINAAANLDIDVTGTFDMLSTGVFSIDGTGASNVSATSGSLTLSTITTGSLIATSAADVDINATTGVTVDGTAISIDGTAASNFTVTGAADLTLSSTLGSVVVTSGESAADGVRINATGANGGVDIDALLGGVAIDTTAGISLDAAGASNFTVAGAQLQLSTTGSGELDLTSAGLIDINAAANLDIDVTGTFDMLSTSTFSIDGTGASNVSATSGNLTISTITTGSLVLTSAGLMDMNAGASLDIDVTGSTALTSSTGTTIENTTSGNILIDSQGATSKIIAMLGTDTAATGLEIQNNSATVLFSIVGTGQADFNFNLDANAGLDVSGGNLTLDSSDLIINTNKFIVDGATGDTTIAGSALIAGNLTVQGTITGIVTEDMIMRDNYLQQNVGYVTVAAMTGGLVANYLPTATNDTATGNFVAGVPATSNPTVGTTGVATFSANDIIQISSSTSNLNDGFFEVLTHAANVLTIRGVGLSATLQPFSRNQFIAQAAGSAVIRKVTVSVIRTGTDGMWEVGSGSTNAFTYTDLVTSSTGMSLQAAYEGGNTITTSAGEGDINFAGTQDFNIALSNISMNPTGDFVLNLDSNQVARVGVGASTATETPSDFSVTDGTLYFSVGNRYDEAEYFAIFGDADIVSIESATSMLLTAATLGLVGSAQIEMTVADNSGSVLGIVDSTNTYLAIHTNTGAETIQLGDAGLATQEVHVAAPRGLRFGLGENNKGTTYIDKYGTHVICYLPATKSSTVAQGVAFLTSGAFEVSGLAADVDQVTVPEMVRGVAQATVAATGYVKVQTSGIAEIEVDQTGSPAVTAGLLMKWALNGKICLDSRDLSASAPYYEELAGVVVSAANRAGTAYNPGVQNRVQVLLANPVAGTYIPA